MIAEGLVIVTNLGFQLFGTISKRGAGNFGSVYLHPSGTHIEFPDLAIYSEFNAKHSEHRFQVAHIANQ